MQHCWIFLRALESQPEREHQKQNHFHLDGCFSNLETGSQILGQDLFEKTSKRVGYAAGGGRWAHFFKSHLSIA